MSEIPFVDQLGDAIDAAIAREAAAIVQLPTGSRWRLPRLGSVRSRRGAVVVLAVLAIGSGAAALAQTLQSSTALVTGGIACYEGTGTSARSAYFDIEANGRTPQAACAQVYRTSGPAALASATLVACADAHGYVAVFTSTGAPAQCRSQGMTPLRTRPYAAAEKHVNQLVSALAGIGVNRSCVPPSTVLARVQGALEHLGWTGWHARLQRQPASSGSCGLFEATGASFSDPTASLDAGHHVVWVVKGPDPAVLTLAGPLDLEFLQASGRHCYTPATARALVTHALADSHVDVAFTLTQEPAGGQMAYAQHAYERGCTIIASTTAAPQGRVVDAQLYSKSAPPAATRTGAAAPGVVQ